MHSVRTGNRIAIFIAALIMALGILLCPHAAYASGSIEVVSSTHDQDTVYSASMIADVDGNPVASALDWDTVAADDRFEGLEGLALTEAVGEVAAVDADGTFVSWLADLSTGTPTLNVTCDAGAFEAEDGWYLLQANAHRPLLVWVRGDAVKIGSKMDTPSLVKEADRTTLGFGDEVNYTLTGTVPTTYDLYTSYECGITDVWDKHLTFKPGTLRVMLEQGASEIDITEFATVTNDANTLDIYFEDLRKTPAMVGDSVVVSYTLVYSIPGGEEEISFLNSAVLFFPQGETPPSETKVYLFHINIIKTDASGTPLSGAQFALKDADGNWLATDGSFGGEANRMTFTSNDKGMVTDIPNVDAGTYVLTELTAPNGYELPANPDSTVVISASVDKDELSMDVSSSGLATVVSVDAANNSTLLSVVNTPEGFFAKLLPKTGDPMRLVFFVGLIVAIAALAFGVARYSRRRTIEKSE